MDAASVFTVLIIESKSQSRINDTGLVKLQEPESVGQCRYITIEIHHLETATICITGSCVALRHKGGDAQLVQECPT